MIDFKREYEGTFPDPEDIYACLFGWKLVTRLGFCIPRIDRSSTFYLLDEEGSQARVWKEPNGKILHIQLRAGSREQLDRRIVIASIEAALDREGCLLVHAADLARDWREVVE